MYLLKYPLLNPRTLGVGVVCIAMLLSLAPDVHAQIVPCGYEGAEGGRECTINHLFTLLIGIYNFLLGMAAIVAVLMIIIGGIGMFVYHWFENAEQILYGSKLTVTRAIFGLIVVAAAYLITNTLLVLLGIAPDSAIGMLLKSLGFTIQGE